MGVGPMWAVSHSFRCAQNRLARKSKPRSSPLTWSEPKMMRSALRMKNSRASSRRALISRTIQRVVQYTEVETNRQRKGGVGSVR